MPDALKKSLPMGLACALVALGYALMMHHEMKDAPISASIVSVSGTFLSGTAIWYWLLAMKGRYTAFRGIAAGLVTGWLSQYFGVAGGLVVSTLMETSTPSVTLSNLFKAVFWSPVITVFTFFLFGWMAILACAVIGVILVKMQVKAIGNGACRHHQ